MAQQEPDLCIDINRIAAYLIIEGTKDALSAIEARLKAGGQPKEVEGWIETGKLKPWKGLEKSILVLLPVYPGLIEVLQDHNLRQKLLLHDTGGGLLFCIPAIKEYLPSARVSHISGIAKEVKTADSVLRQAFLYGSYGHSLKSLFDQVRQGLDPDFAELIDYRFQDLICRMDRAGVIEFIRLQLPVAEYDSRLQGIFRSIAIVAYDSVNLGLRFVRKLGHDQQAHHKEIILRVTLTVISELATLKVLCDKYNRSESYRLEDSSQRLKELERAITSAA